MKTLSDYYAEDLSRAVFLPEYPSSNNPSARFFNRSRYLIHDPVPPPDGALLNILGPHHLLSAWGDRLPAWPGRPPSAALRAHWEEKLGFSPQIVAPASRDICITLFPLETIELRRHAVRPDVHYELLSKETIRRIPCPQPAVVGPGAYPCVLKLSHGYSGTGNYFLTSETDDRRACGIVERNWPAARTVRTEVVGSVRGDYCTQFYLTREGRIHWIGVTDQVFDPQGRWSGASIEAELQADLRDRLMPVVRPVAAYLHAKGYFGLTGVDILRDASDRLYVVDLNPRINGSTPFLLMFQTMRERGLAAGCYYSSVEYAGPGDALIEATRPRRRQEEIVLLSYIEGPNSDTTECHVAVFAETLDACQRIFRRVFATSEAGREDASP